MFGNVYRKNGYVKRLNLQETTVKHKRDTLCSCKIGNKNHDLKMIISFGGWVKLGIPNKLSSWRKPETRPCLLRVAIWILWFFPSVVLSRWMHRFIPRRTDIQLRWWKFVGINTWGETKNHVVFLIRKEDTSLTQRIYVWVYLPTFTIKNQPFM